jgi:dihydroxyacetone kinase DhaKLM complex PTS-EIIA-like component DhaM
VSCLVGHHHIEALQSNILQVTVLQRDAQSRAWWWSERKGEAGTSAPRVRAGIIFDNDDDVKVLQECGLARLRHDRALAMLDGGAT